MKTLLGRLALIASPCFLLLGCSSTPPPPDWKMNAVSLLEHHQARWLEGDSKAAELALQKARLEIAKSGRLDLLARLELAACGTRIAALDFTECAAFLPLKSEATAADQAYAQFLAGQWAGLDPKLLPTHYSAVLTAKDDLNANQGIAAITEALPRLIATGVLFKQARAMPSTLSLAADTASERGWRRPLLTWLEVQKTRATAAGETQAAAQLKRRIEFVQSAPQP